MLSPRSWTCTYTSDTHKKPKNARWVDGILEVSFLGATERFAKLYAADDDNKPVGAPVARRKLGDAEFDAIKEGDPVKGLEGFDVHPDDEISLKNDAGGDAKRETRDTKDDAEKKSVPFAPRLTRGGAAPGASNAALRPFRAPAMKPSNTAKSSATTTDAQKNARPLVLTGDRKENPGSGSVRDPVTLGDGSDSESDGSDGSLDPRAALKRFAGDGSGSFADLYAAARETSGSGSRSVKDVRSRNNPALGVPLASRVSKYAAFEKNEAPGALRSERAGENRKDPGDPGNAERLPRGGVSDLAAALARAGGPAGVASLASLAASFGTSSEAPIDLVGGAPSEALPGDAIPPRGPPKKTRRAPPNANGVLAREPRNGGAMGGWNKTSPSGPEDDTALRLAFPSASSHPGARDVQPPSSFADAEAYRAHFCGALRAEMEETLHRARLDLERVASGVARSAAGAAARRGDDREEAARVSRAFRAGAASLGAAYHADCTVRFETFANGTKPSLAGGKKRRGGGDDDDEAGRTDAAAAPVAAPTTKTFLYLNDPDERRGGASRAGAPRYCKGDLWVLANTARFESVSSDRVGDKTKAPFAAVARALWHGPDKDGKMEIQLLCARPGALAGGRRAHRVYAMRARDASRALAEHDAFASMTVASFPLLPHVAGAPLATDRIGDVADDDGPTRDLDELATSARLVREKYELNRDQAFAVSKALRAVVEAARRVPLGERTVSPVRLVHGPFGSGKTRALASFVVEAASRLKDSGHPDFRVLLTAHTNVAVDRLLKALLDVGFDDFVRVGALRKMDPAVLSHSLHVAASSSRGGADENEPVLGRGGRPLRGKGADHALELRAMLRDATNARERAALARELRETQEGKADARARALGKCRVVATTAASCANECLRDSTFQLVVLDEASQITEPAFVAAVAPFGCETLIAVGDPKQLGPVVENDGDRNTHDDSRVNRAVSAFRSRSLFARLADMGHAPTLLKAQYRCHPALSAVANACFYGGKLEDGIDKSDRAPLLRFVRAGSVSENTSATEVVAYTPMPPLVWADVATSTGASRDVMYDKTRSAFSVREARIAALVVDRLVKLGICPSEIGVVTLFRAHAKAVERALVAALETGIRDGDGPISAPPLRDVASGSPPPPSSSSLNARAKTQVSTVDAFQGQEKEVIVLSLCGGGGGAFASDERLNVALTRAKRHLIVLGDSKDPSAKNTEAWRMCLRTAQRAPCGFVDAGSVRSEAATIAWLAGWRRNDDEEDFAGRDRDRKPSPRRNAREEETRDKDAEDEKSDGDESDGGGDDDDDASRSSPSPDPFDPIVLSGDEDTLYIPAGSPLSRSPLLGSSPNGEETKRRAKKRVLPRSASPLAKKKPLLRLETKRKRETREDLKKRDASPDPDLDSLPPARLAFHDALRGVSFGPEQYWRAYCDLHRAALYGDKAARARVECSRLGAVLATHFKLDLGVSRAWDRSETRRLVTNSVLPGMATFVHATHGYKWTRLVNLIEAFDDAEVLKKDPKGFGAHVLEDARTQEEDEAGASAFADGAR